MAEGIEALSEKEKDTLRLMLRGHDAKSIARTLDLSVHTIHDRLRAARRKLSVTSSREAARRLMQHEAASPENLAHDQFGGASSRPDIDQSNPSNGRYGSDRGTGRASAWLIGGLIVMSLFFAVLLAGSPFVGEAATDGRTAEVAVEVAAADSAVESAARNWLALADAADWPASYAATGSAFRELNALAAWTSASVQAREPLGAVISREAVSFRHVNAPPHGYREVVFESGFANREQAVETVTLEREDGEWKVVGYLIE